MFTINHLLALAASSLAQTTTSASASATRSPAPSLNNSQPALNGLFFFNSTGPVQGSTASLLCADPSNTTFILGCASTSPAGNTICATDRQIQVTATACPTNYDLIYSTATQGGSGLVTQSCDFGGPSAEATEVVCSESGYIAIGGRPITLLSTEYTIGVTRSAAPTWEVEVTAGAVRNEACTATSTPSVSVMRTTSVLGQSQGSMVANSAPTGGAREVYKVLVPAGAAALAYAI